MAPRNDRSAGWRCAVRKREADRRYERTPKALERRHTYNAKETTRIRKQLYDLTRIRPY